MSKRLSKRPAADKGAGRKKARKAAADAADAEGEDAGFFLLEDDDGQHRKQQAEESEDEEQRETAEEKRLRLAREFLDRMRDEERAGEDGGDDDDDDEERRGVTGGKDRLAERLQQEAAEAQGRLHRNLAHRISVPNQTRPAPNLGPESDASSSGGSESEDDCDGEGGSESGRSDEEAGGARAAAGRRARMAVPLYGAGRFAAGHAASATALALSVDGATAFTVGKDGRILRWDVEAMKSSELSRPGGSQPAAPEPEAADWVQRRSTGHGVLRALYAAALSSDGRFLAVGGGDRKVHVFDVAAGRHVASYPGHRDAVTALVFREGSHMLYSGSLDRTVKIWSVDDGAYVDTLFGHQGEVYGLDALRQERVVSCGHDHTCRVWKVQEESHLIFRAHHPAVECCRYITGTEWLSGASDGSLQVWSQMKKKPVSVLRGAHRRVQPPPAGAPPPARDGPWATANSEAASWVQAVAVARGSDLAASGAGDGALRLWAVEESKHGGAGALRAVGELPAMGFVNGLAIERHGRFVAAAIGNETRLGRWGRVEGARSGLLVHPLVVAPEDGE